MNGINDQIVEIVVYRFRPFLQKSTAFFNNTLKYLAGNSNT